MNLYIESIASKEQPFWRPMYELIKNLYFTSTKLFPTNFLDQCRNNTHEPENIPNEIKAALKQKDMEQCLYAQVVMIR